jgi:hypothetical protein
MISPISAVILGADASSIPLMKALSESDQVETIAIRNLDGSLTCPPGLASQKLRLLNTPDEGIRISEIIAKAKNSYLLLALPGHDINLGQRCIERMLEVAISTGAGMVYSDFRDQVGLETTDHPLIDYQLGSIRDTFDFGPVQMISIARAREALKSHGDLDSIADWSDLYELRLKTSIDSELLRIPEPLYTRVPKDRRSTGERQFDYIDPRQREYQRQMENVATAHLKRIGAYLQPGFHEVPSFQDRFPVRASIVVPVRNRIRTIKDAIASALSQQTTFPFNVIVVDNHSTDGTTQILSELTESHKDLVHMIPGRTDLGIGGCWNQAIFSAECGEYAVQLDSDDLYKDEHTLQTIVDKFGEGRYAMVIGAYSLVNFELQEIPPGLIDHNEWTRENGRNNALRISGMGAPRAFYVPLLRQFGFPNTSYGEDYAVAIRISRQYEIGRIYESLYFARRWEGNSDAALPIATANRYDAYKDRLRSIEILARRRLNQGELA